MLVSGLSWAYEKKESDDGNEIPQLFICFIQENAMKERIGD